jgi:ribosomal protein L3
MKVNNLVAKHSPHRASTHKDRKRASRQVRGHKHKESDMGQKDDIPELTISEIIEELADMGYSTDALSNDELIDLHIAVMDGHRDEALEELDFSDD